MGQGGWLARIGLLIGGLVAAIVVLVLLGWIWSPKPIDSPADSASRSAPGWEVRYNATIALARRGSENIAERMDVLQEMLDEEQQMQNFRIRQKRGDREVEVANETAARTTVINALKAVIELRRKQPDLDLSRLDEALQKLARSPNVVVRTEAERTRLALAKQPG